MRRCCPRSFYTRSGALQKPFCSATYNLTDPRSHWLHGHQVVVLVVRYFVFWSYWKTRVGISWFPGSTGRKAIPQLFWCTVGVVSFTIPYNTRHRATMLLQLKIKDGRTYPGDPVCRASPAVNCGHGWNLLLVGGAYLGGERYGDGFTAWHAKGAIFGFLSSSEVWPTIGHPWNPV